MLSLIKAVPYAVVLGLLASFVLSAMASARDPDYLDLSRDEQSLRDLDSFASGLLYSVFPFLCGILSSLFVVVTWVGSKLRFGWAVYWAACTGLLLLAVSIKPPRFVLNLSEIEDSWNLIVLVATAAIPVGAMLYQQPAQKE